VRARACVRVCVNKEWYTQGAQEEVQSPIISLWPSGAVGRVCVGRSYVVDCVQFFVTLPRPLQCLSEYGWEWVCSLQRCSCMTQLSEDLHHHWLWGWVLACAVRPAAKFVHLGLFVCSCPSCI